MIIRFIFGIGVENEITLGSPISFLIMNENVIKKDYKKFEDVPRPGHADLTYLMKYSIKSESGGGIITKFSFLYFLNKFI